MKGKISTRALLATLLVSTALLVMACAPTSAPAPGPAPAATQPPAAQATEAPAAQATEAPAAAPTTAPAAAGNKVITIAYTQEPNNLNPLYTNQWFTANLFDLYLDNALITFNDKNEPLPWIATEIPTIENGGISADGKTITFKLRDDVKWSDGTPLTADDYVFTYEMILNDKNTVTSRDPFEAEVASVVAQDPQTLVVTFNEPYAPWMTSIFSRANSTVALPKHILQPVFESEGTLDNAAWNRAPTVGVGPFLFNEWETGSHLSFNANPDFWMGAPKADQIFFRIVPDDASQLAAIKAGDVDIGVFISPSDVPDLEALGTVDIPKVPSGYKESWYFNMSAEGDTAGHPGLQDPNVRRAVVMAVDRNKITEELLYGLTKPALTFWDGMAQANPDIEPIPYDPEGAKKLLDDAGWVVGSDGIREKDGVKLKLRYVTTTREVRENTQAIVQQQWKDIGVDAELINHPSDVFFSSFGDQGPVATGQYDIAEWSNSPQFPDPNTVDWLCSEIPSADNPPGGNWEFICDEELDALLQEQAQTVDANKRIELFHQIQQIIADKVYWVSIWDDPDLWSVSKKVTGVKFSGATPFWNAYEWDKTQ